MIWLTDWLRKAWLQDRPVALFYTSGGSNEEINMQPCPVELSSDCCRQTADYLRTELFEFQFGIIVVWKVVVEVIVVAVAEAAGVVIEGGAVA